MSATARIAASSGAMNTARAGAARARSASSQGRKPAGDARERERLAWRGSRMRSWQVGHSVVRRSSRHSAIGT